MMQKGITVENFGYQVEYPDKCPVCHHYGDIKLIKTSDVNRGQRVEIIYQCPFQECGRFYWYVWSKKLSYFRKISSFNSGNKSFSRTNWKNIA